MKRILFIAPASYPVGDAEAIVNMKLLQAMSRCGKFRVDLVSKKYRHINYPSASIDSYGVNLDSVSIIESDNIINVKTIWKSLVTLFKFGAIFKGCHWALEALPTIDRLVKQNNYDYVVTKNLASYLIGSYLQKKYSLKWIATWNDPKPDSKYPVPYGKGLEYDSILDRLEIRIMRRADIHVFPSDRLMNYMNNYLKLPSEKVRILPHVVLEENAEGYKNEHNALKLIHSGNLASPRDPSTFLRGLSIFLKRQNKPAIEFSILGKVDESVRLEIGRLGLNEYVRILPPVEYRKSLSLLKDYDTAVIIEADCKEGIFLPTKVSDFMQESIPILAISPRVGMLHDLNNLGSIPYYADVTNPEMIAETLALIYKDYNNRQLRKNNIPNVYKEDYICQSYYNL